MSTRDPDEGSRYRRLPTDVEVAVRTPSVLAIGEVLQYTGYGRLDVALLPAGRPAAAGPLALRSPDGAAIATSEQERVQEVLLRHGYAALTAHDRIVVLDPLDSEARVLVGHLPDAAGSATVRRAVEVLVDAGHRPALFLGELPLRSGFRVATAAAETEVVIVPAPHWDDAEPSALARSLRVAGLAVRGELEGTGTFEAAVPI
ncbi:hypothetical protein ABT095_14945 [Kitasatospora sp. NPDC002227]|uniref:hypothetical protein n=1 Tax=Kitasatospora sp. NPDC002227 TaxID=3154773 RepID=UPI0033223286